MLQWVTFALALFSAVLWVAVIVVGARVYSGYRRQVQAARMLAAAMQAATAARRPAPGPQFHGPA
jgi:hypothetical protein